MEHGDTGLGRDAYGVPRRRHLGQRRAYRLGRSAEGSGARGTNGEDGPGDDEDDEYYGQLLRRPGDLPAYPRQPSPPRMRRPGRLPPPSDRYPPNGNPGGYPASGNPPGGYPPGGNPADRYPPGGNPAGGHPPGGNPADRYPPGGNPAGGFAGNADPAAGYSPKGNVAADAPLNSGRQRGAGYGGRVSGAEREHRPNGRGVPPAVDRPYHPPAPDSAGGTYGRRGPGQDPSGGMWRWPAQPSPAPGAPPGPGGTQAYGGKSGSGPAGPAVAQPGASGWEHLTVPPAHRGVPVSETPAASGGPADPARPVIRRRETASPDRRPTGAPQSVASIAPDGLESFARDLRALRANAELDYPQLAELSHYTMKTLASAAGGLRLPTLPVAVAYVRACGGNIAEWEDRWQKLAEKIIADEAKKRRSEDDEQQAPPEPADAPGLAEPPAWPAAHDPDPGPGEVYVITSAKPRQPGWPGGQGPAGNGGADSPS